MEAMVGYAFAQMPTKQEDTEVYAISDPLFSTLDSPATTAKVPSKALQKWEVKFLLRGVEVRLGLERTKGLGQSHEG